MEYPTYEYLRSFLDSDKTAALYCLSKFSTNLKLFTDKPLTLEVNEPSIPGEVKYNDVFSSVYPVPALRTLTSIILPFSIIALKSAPKPSPSTLISGGAVYPVPWFCISTEYIYRLI